MSNISKYNLKIIYISFIIFLLINSLIISSSNMTNAKIEFSDNNFLTINVGGLGDGNYSSINEAINNSNNGDIIYVYDDSSPYNESILINKSISLIGEDKTTTIIDGINENSVITIKADNVHIMGFTIKNSKEGLFNAGVILDNVEDVNVTENIICNNVNCGIYVINSSSSLYIYNNDILYNGYGICVKNSLNNIIVNNNIEENLNGVYLIDSMNNIITQNNFTNKWTGLQVEYSNSNLISDNVFLKNADGVYLYKSFNNSIYQNIINNNYWFGVWLSNSSDNLINSNIINKNDDIGIYLHESDANIISENILSRNDDGIFIESSFDNSINKNYFQNIKLNGYFVAYRLNQCINDWNNNYWDHPRFIPFPILGKIKFDRIHISFINFDWMPISNSVQLSSFIRNNIINGEYGNGDRILYVGCNGNDDYSTIQQAVNDAKPGDIIFVYNGFYHENIIINKSLTLIGEDKYNTVIDGYGYGDIITFNADNISIKGFTIQNGHYGIFSENTSDHEINDNNIFYNLQGVSFFNCSNLLIKNNDFIENQYSIRLFFCSNIIINHNNFNSYKLHLFFVEDNGLIQKGDWDMNYWGKTHYLPFMIVGKKYFGDDSRVWFHFDWNPLKIPFTSN